MKYIFSFCILFLLNANSLFSQIRIVDSADTTNFPEIEFSINNRSPDLLSLSSFKFSEFIDGKIIVSDSINIYRIKDSTDYSKSNKCVLILLETLLHEQRKEQNHTFKSSILEVLDKVVNKGDEFKIVTFSLKNGKNNILHDVNNTFTDSISLLKNALKSHRTTYNDFTNKYVSNIYGAIIEAVVQLDDFDSNLPKSILLLSEEFHNREIINVRESALDLAKEKGIVINAIKYNRRFYETHADPSLAIKTYGLSKVLSRSSGDLDYVNKEKKLESNNYIESILNNVVERSLGLDYNIVIKLKDTVKDGKDRVVELNINGSNEVLKIDYKAPGNWLVAQFQTDLYRSIFVLLVLILISAFLINYLRKKRKISQANQATKILQQKEKEAEQEAHILAQKEELLIIKNQQKKIKKQEEEEIKKSNERALIKQMLSSGSFPILKFSDSKTSTQFEINNPIVKIGRDKSTNTICISNNNISRNHFSIVYKNNHYTVIDNNSLNGIKLNGRKLKESVLKHADIIEIADLSFTFYE
ncbi:FHA domain-containing protein [Flavobacteriaceae bacterium]|nr:FHA domain-containing protein [Flavobacteriaceae bacterium]